MDITRRARAPWRMWVAAGAALLVLAALIPAWAMLTHRSVGVSVDRSTIVTATARIGNIDRTVGAPGSLASKSVRIVATSESGTVATVLVKPGAQVDAGDPIARLENPQLEAAVVDADSALRVARAELASAREQARAAALSQQSALASAQAQMQEDQTNARSLRSLHRSGLIADSTYRIARIRDAQSARQVRISESQVSVAAADQRAKIAAAQAQVDEAAAQLSTREAQVAALIVRTGGPGVVQSVTADLGAHIDVGSEVARVADQHALKAVLAVPEGLAHDVVVGMRAQIDTGNGIVVGRVARIAPAAQNGSVAVDIAFFRPLPRGARPDLSVDGVIELERIPRALSIARPANALDNTTVTLFRLNHNGSRALPVQVHLGRGSVNRVQVLSGLSPGDTVIISDTSAYDAQPLLRIH